MGLHHAHYWAQLLSHKSVLDQYNEAKSLVTKSKESSNTVGYLIGEAKSLTEKAKKYSDMGSGIGKAAKSISGFFHLKNGHNGLEDLLQVFNNVEKADNEHKKVDAQLDYVKAGFEKLDKAIGLFKHFSHKDKIFENDLFEGWLKFCVEELKENHSKDLKNLRSNISSFENLAELIGNDKQNGMKYVIEAKNFMKKLKEGKNISLKEKNSHKLGKILFELFQTKNPHNQKFLSTFETLSKNFTLSQKKNNI